MNCIAIFCVFSVFLLSAEAATPFHVVLKKDVCKVWWGYDEATATFNFKLMMKTTGWASLALSYTKDAEGMINYDIALGGVTANGTKYLNDYWTTKKMFPNLDDKQSLTLKNATEMNGWTTLEYSRKADTMDATEDIKIEKGKTVYFAWAFNDKDATGPKSFDKHTSKGHTTVGYDMFTGKEQSSGSALVSSAILVAIAAVANFLA